MLTPVVQTTVDDDGQTQPPQQASQQQQQQQQPPPSPPPTTRGRVWCESWLEKKAQWRFAWDRRLVVLDGRRLSYHVSATAPEKKAGTVRTLHAVVASEQQPYTFAVTLVEGGGGGGGGETWTLRAPDHATYAQWIDAIARALAEGNSDSNNSAAVAASAQPSQQQQLPPSSAALTSSATAAHTTTDAPHAPSSLHTPAQQQQPSSSLLSPAATPMLVAAVRKQSAWAGVWKPRVLELYGGLQLAYRATASSPVRNRYTILALDKAATVTMAVATTRTTTTTHVLISTTCGDKFWVQFANADEAAHWCDVVEGELRRHRCWQWMLLPGTSVRAMAGGGAVSAAAAAAAGVVAGSGSSAGGGGGGASAVLPAALAGDGGTRGYAMLRTHYHAAAYAPHYTVPGAMALYVYGGSRQWCGLEFCASARAFVPQPQSTQLLRSLRVLELAGAHAVHTMTLDAHEVTPGVCVRPPALCGASLCTMRGPCIQPKSSRNGGNNNTATTAAAAAPRTRADVPLLVLLGGLTGLAGGASRTEVWTAWVPHVATASSSAAAAQQQQQQQQRGSSSSQYSAPCAPCWRRHTLPTYELPQLAFHDALALPVCDDGGDATATATAHDNMRDTWLSSSSPLSLCRVLVTGGLDKDCRARAECYLLTWCANDDDNNNDNNTTRTHVDKHNTSSSSSSSSQPLRVRSFGFLPEARAFHRTAVLCEGTVVLVGGRGMENAEVAHTVLTLSRDVYDAAPDDDVTATTAAAAATAWRPVRYDTTRGTALPQLPDVAVATTPRGMRVVALAQHSTPTHAVRLYMLDFDVHGSGDGDATGPGELLLLRWHEVLVRVGAAPCRAVGCSLHTHGDYVYVLGGGEACTTAATAAAAERTASLRADAVVTPQRLCEPLRLLVNAW